MLFPECDYLALNSVRFFFGIASHAQLLSSIGSKYSFKTVNMEMIVQGNRNVTFILL